MKKDLSQQHTPDTFKCYLLHQDGSEIFSQVFVWFCKFGLNTKTFVLYYSKLLFAIPCIVLKMKKSCLRTDIYCHNHYLSAFLFHYFHLKWFFQYIFWKKIIAFIFLLVYFESWDCRTFLSCLHYNCRQVILWIIFWQLVKTLKFLCGCNQNKSIIF